MIRSYSSWSLSSSVNADDGYDESPLVLVVSVREEEVDVDDV